MEDWKDLWHDFISFNSVARVIWHFVSLLTIPVSWFLLFWVQEISLFQILLIVTPGVLVLLYNLIMVYNDTIEFFDFMCWLSIICVVMWMLPISIFWSLIPLAILTILTGLTMTDDDPNCMIIVVFILIMSIAALHSVNDARIINSYLASNPVVDTVVINNIDIDKKIMFINENEYSLSLGRFKISELTDSNYKQGDTVKIIRHPKFNDTVIRISK